MVRKAFLEYSRIKVLPTSAFRCLATTRIFGDIRDHAEIEDRLSVGPAIVDAIQTDGRTVQVRANGASHSGEFGQRVAQQRRLIAVAWRAYEWRDDVAVAIAE
jgi:putative SOS response-associated peptidase YedK